MSNWDLLLYGLIATWTLVLACVPVGIAFHIREERREQRASSTNVAAGPLPAATPEPDISGHTSAALPALTLLPGRAAETSSNPKGAR